jgi:xanthine dehydrogenase accessory factor
MEKIAQAMQELCAQDQSFALATIISRNGSAPRSAGAKMLVRMDGSIVGTVGGGSLEAKVQKLAQEMIFSRQATVCSFSFTGKDAATMDSICGGEVEILVEWLDGSDPQLSSIAQALNQALVHHSKAWLLTIFSAHIGSTEHALVQADDNLIGALPTGVTFETIRGVKTLEKIDLTEQTVLVEPAAVAGTAYIFGAGHVSRSLAEFVKAVGFWTVVIDDRAEFANCDRFPEADDILVPASFADIMQQLAVDPYSFLVIVTRGHLNDRLVLTQALKTNAGYIGMIGSRRKCELIYQELYKEGFTAQDIQRVHAPIGLPIQAETPEEIGISVVAEMIQARAKMILPQ